MPRQSVARIARWSAVAAGAVILAITSLPLSAQQAIDPAKEQQVKGVFLYSFGRYVTWPANFESDQFVIGVLGDSRIHSTLAQVAKRKTLKGQRIEILRFKSPEQISACRILFIPSNVVEEDEQAALRLACGKNILVVGETAGFTQRGGGIRFFVDGSTIRFQINVVATKAEGLQLDAKLLTIGEVVSFPVVQQETAGVD